jgi:hypothetical protein
VVASSEPVTKVRVLEPFGVFHDGTAYLPESVVDVPESIAAHWLSNGWADRAD